jgi:acetyl-CoA carboxylase biotin carboxylase subunit
MRTPLFNKVMVANRGAVAARVLRALRSLGIRSVAVYSEADADAPYLEQADEAYLLGPAPARQSYMNVESIVRVLRHTGADGLHPGYGFLSENAEFARRVESAGCRFIGPAPHWLDAMGHKTRARDLAQQHGLPVGRGSPVLSAGSADLMEHAASVGFPLLVKPAGGGGGIGMIVARQPGEVVPAVERASSLALRGFGNADVFFERYLDRPRHIEFQLLGDQHGVVRHLFDRDCSVQRRHQKVIEEAPAPMTDRRAVEATAEQLAGVFGTLGYDNLGTVEMLMGGDGTFHFLEMNTRLQVEHGVTEEVTGVDLVAAQIRAAAGERLSDILPDRLTTGGHAIQARIYAEDPKRFLPSPGRLIRFRPPRGSGIRIESGTSEGAHISTHYDPMLAKVIAHASTRMQAIAKLREALQAFEIEGVKTNLPVLDLVLGSEAFACGAVHTGLLAELMN